MATKTDAVPSNKADYVITKLDDLVNWARRVRIQYNYSAQLYSALRLAFKTDVVILYEWNNL